MKKGDKVFVEATFRERFDEQHVSIDFPAGYRVVIDEKVTELFGSNLFLNSFGATSLFFQRMMEAEKIIDKLSVVSVKGLTVEALNYRNKWKGKDLEKRFIEVPEEMIKNLKDLEPGQIEKSIQESLRMPLPPNYKAEMAVKHHLGRSGTPIDPDESRGRDILAKFPQTAQDDALDEMMIHQSLKNEALAKFSHIDTRINSGSPSPEDSRKFMIDQLAPFTEEGSNESDDNE